MKDCFHIALAVRNVYCSVQKMGRVKSAPFLQPETDRREEHTIYCLVPCKLVTYIRFNNW